MLYLTHLHPASARSATLRTAPQTLAFIGHTAIDILALPSSSSSNSVPIEEPLAKLATLPLNARILQASTLPSIPGSLLILTDHPIPRLIILVPQPSQQSTDRPTSYATHTVVQLQDSVRSPAELGIGMSLDQFAGIGSAHSPVVFTHTYSGNARVVPLAAEALAEPPSAQSGIGALASFDVRLPHPTLLQTTFLDSRNLSTGPLPPLVALLSLSSTPTSLPGLGPQCLPVLSFHWIDLDKQELTPCPWGPPPTSTPISPSSSSKPTNKAAEGTSTPPPVAPGGSNRRSTRNGARIATYGPSARGADRSIEALLARDKKLAAQGIARAHVPIPYIEALGMHYMLALPARAGGGVLVFSETCVLYVPPPPSALGDSPAFAGSSAENSEVGVGEGSGVGSSNTPTKGKRRKGPESELDGFSASSQSSSTSPHEPSHTVNEHGKRRRASETASAHTSREIIRTSFRKPVQVVAAIVQAEPASGDEGDDDDDGVKQTSPDGRTAVIRILFGTQAGILNSLLISLGAEGPTSSSSEGKKRPLYSPLSMQISKIGSIPRPGSGAGGLLYLGDGFLQVASMVGDSALVRIDPSFRSSVPASSQTELSEGKEDWEDGENMEIDDERVDGVVQSTAGKSSGVQEFKRFPNLAPIVDFVIDRGAASSSSSAGSSNLPARIVTCSGTGPSGSLRSVRTGAELNERGSISLGSGPGSAPTSVFLLRGGGEGASREESVVLLSYPERTEGFTQTVVDGDLRWEALSGLEDVGLGGEAVLAAAALREAESIFVVVSVWGVRVLQARGSEIKLLAQWKGEVGTTIAAADEAGRVVLASESRSILHLQVRIAQTASIEVVTSIEAQDEVASLNLQTIEDAFGSYTLASVGFFVQRSVRLFALPWMEDVTPELLSMQVFSSLPCRVLVRLFGTAGASAGSSTYLFVGFVDGTLVSFRLDRAALEAGSSEGVPKLTINDRRTISLGSTPVRSLTPLRSTKGVEGILVAGDKSILLYEQNGRLSYSALSYGPLRAASATLPAGPHRPSEVILLQSSGSSSHNSASSSSSSLHVLQVGEAKKIEIETLGLGVDNPLGIALDGSEGKRAFGVVTWKYVAEGEGAVVDAKGKSKKGKGVRGKVIVVDQESFETIDSLDLEAGEHPHCIECVNLGDRTFFVVGTGWDNPMESETLSGRIIGLELVPSRWKSGDRELSIAFSQKVRGGVNAVVGAEGCIVAAINSQVVLYKTRPSQSAERELSLQRHAAWACAFFATTLVAPRADPGRLLVGDAMRSFVVLKLDVENDKLVEIARECDPSWTSAVEELSSVGQSFVGADMSFNLFVSARTVMNAAVQARKEQQVVAGGGMVEGSSNVEPVAERDFTHVIKRRGAFHLGDMVNRFRKGALLHAEGLSILKDTIRPNIVFCTAGGALGILADIGRRSSTLLSGLVQAVDAEYPTLGNIPLREWRAFRTDHREMMSFGFVDGDVLLGRFLGLGEGERERVVERWKVEMGEADGGGGGEGMDDVLEEFGDGGGLVDAVAGLARLC
ncbi:hypothetical protein CF327_g3020 [Tilletia walkeri]|nr:hypothetical protein CF327_g3020 [Tilletia walkeri]